MPTSLKAESLAYHFDANAASVTGITSFLALIRQWVQNAAGRARELIDTPEERAAVEKIIKDQYERLLLNSSDPTVKVIAAAAEPFVLAMVYRLLIQLAGGD